MKLLATSAFLCTILPKSVREVSHFRSPRCVTKTSQRRSRSSEDIFVHVNNLDLEEAAMLQWGRKRSWGSD